MKQNVQASQRQIAAVLGLFLANAPRPRRCSPANTVLSGVEAPSIPLCSGEGILAGAGTAMGTCNSGDEALAGVAHPVRLLSSCQLPFSKNDSLHHKVPTTKRVAEIPKHQDTDNSFLLFRYIFQAFLQASLLRDSRLIFLRLRHLF